MRSRPLEQRAFDAWMLCTNLRRFHAEGRYDAAWAALGHLWQVRQDKNEFVARLAVTTFETMEHALIESDQQCGLQSSIP